MSLSLMANINIGDGDVAITQLVGFDFNSYADLGNGHYIAGSTAGLHEVGGSGSHIGKPESSFTTFKVRMGYDGHKRLRYLYLGVQTHGKLKITPIADDIEGEPITVTPVRSGYQILRVTVPMLKYGKYRNRALYWSFKVENVSGCWFSLDFIKAAPINLSMGRAAA